MSVLLWISSSDFASSSPDLLQGAVIDALMAQKKNGNIPGIIGRLGDLGAIDKMYDVAVSGSYLEFHIDSIPNSLDWSPDLLEC